jgi:SAM-dependent methyltransferase
MSSSISQPLVVHVSSDLVRLAETMARNYAAATGADPMEYYLDYYLNIQSHLNVLYPIGQALGINREQTVVEIGSGMGTRCVVGAALWGARFIGVEPCVNTYTPLKDAIQEFRRTNAGFSYEAVASPGENTGLPAGSADIVVSFEVLEHVQEPVQVVREMFRILKPGGQLFITTCNYHSFYEGHYRCLWLPCLGARSGKYWAQLHGILLPVRFQKAAVGVSIWVASTAPAQRCIP